MIPRREWSEKEEIDLAAELTDILRTPQGTMSLRPKQAVALAEAGLRGGLFAPLRVGAGKTLFSLLVGHVLDSKRPVLLVPAKLIEKTKREMQVLKWHWQIPVNLVIRSYEIHGRVQAADVLDKYQPDLLILDECHRVKNPRAAVSKRVMRYLNNNPECRLVAMSGTITKRSLTDYAHLLRRALGPEQAPVPFKYQELQEWAAVLDERKGDDDRDVGALRLFAEGSRDLSAVRAGFCQRLTQTEGVVATTEARISASLSISSISPSVNREVDSAFKALREEWRLPDGRPLADGLEVWRHARELGLGFFYRWDPEPPKAWLEARKAWCSECRQILNHNHRNLDSELQVANAVSQGLYPHATGIWRAWREIAPSFEPNTKPVWLDDSVLHACVKWAVENPGILWTEHQAFAERLSSMSGLEYYGKRGVNRRGQAIEDAPTNRSCIASIASNGEGRNLQAWNRNLVISPPSSGGAWEQLLGRTHRDGQEADEVTIDLLITCSEHATAFQQAIRDCEYISQTTGQEMKLLIADKDVLERHQR